MRRIHRRRRHRGGGAGSLQPDYALAAQVAPDDPAITDRARRIRLAGRHRHHQRPDGAAGRRDRAAAGGAGRPREPRAQPLHRGRGAAGGQGRLPGARTGRAELARRLSRQRREGPRDAVEPAAGEADGGFLRRLPVSARPPRFHRQGRRRRLLLRRRRLQRARGRLPGDGRLGALLRPPAAGGRRAGDRGAAAAALRRRSTRT